MDCNSASIDRSQLLSKCHILANAPSIPDILEAEIRKQGFAGSADIPKLVFLTFWTSMFDKPVSLLIKGPSGAGKSLCLKSGKQFVPPTAYEQFEGMSEKALVYLEGLNLKNRHLIISEAAGMAQGYGRTLLRQFVSEGTVRYATVQSTSKGLVGKELPPLEGPCGLIMTTTATSLHAEDESRMLSVNVQESASAIADALLAQARGALHRPENVSVNLEPWHALWEYVRSGAKDVAIPYAADIVPRLPQTHDRIKRDFPHVLSLIKASALLHSCTRERGEGGVVVANQLDYELVRGILDKPLSEGLEQNVPDSIRKLVDLVEEKTTGRERERYGLGVSVSQLAEMLDRDPSSVSRNVSNAINSGYLRNENPGQGREARLHVGDRKMQSKSVLPPGDLLFRLKPQANIAPKYAW